MGTPIPWPVEGTLCPRCWGSGKPFYSYAMPHFVQVTFTGIMKGENWHEPLPPPPNGTLEYAQVAACRWRMDSVDAHGTWSLLDIGSILDINVGGWLNIFSGSGGLCALGFPNNNPGWPLFWTGGTGSVTWLGGP